MAFDLLPDLHPRATRATICVRVSRKWEYRGGTDDGPIQHVDLVLIDTKGNSMYGEIPASQIESKSPLIEENGIYVITRFRVSNTKNSFRPVDARFMVEFTFHTRISAARDAAPSFPMFTYRLTSFDRLKPLASHTTSFIDVIGLVVEVSEAYMVQLPNKPRPTLTRHVILRDLSYSEAKVTLWGERASAFSVEHVFDPNEAKPVVVLFVGALMKKFQNNFYLSANTAARWYFNPEIAEAKQLYNSFQDQRMEIKQVPAPAQDTQVRSPAMLQTKSLLELNGMDPYDYAESGYRCTVSIGRLVPNVSWWFPSCTSCSKSCAIDGVGYRCSACSTTSFRFKYKISFIAVDGTDEAEMICFGDVGRQIVGKPVQQVIRATTSANPVPLDITKIISRRFTFAVTLTQQSYYRENKTYQVTSVIQSHTEPNLALAPIQNQDGAPSGCNVGQPAQTAVGQPHIEANADEAPLSPAVLPQSMGSSLVINTTPPPSLYSADTPLPKNTCSRVTGTKGVPPSTRRKLFSDDDDHDDELDSTAEDSDGKEIDDSFIATSDKGVVDTNDVGSQSKRSCAGNGAAQESG